MLSMLSSSISYFFEVGSGVSVYLTVMENQYLFYDSHYKTLNNFQNHRVPGMPQLFIVGY
jgi:hypothetical protein